MSRRFVLPTMILAAMLAAAPSRGTEPLYRPASPPHLELVHEGQARASVVVPPQAPLEVRRAAEELVRCIRQMSGATLPIAPIAEVGPAVVLRIDSSVNPPSAGRRSWTGSRGYRLQVQGDKVLVVGSDALAVLHGTYGLLERHLGVRWLWPGELGEILPKTKTVRVGRIDEASVPDFAVRWVGTGDWALSAAPDGPPRERVLLFKTAFDETRQSLTGMKKKGR